MAIETELKLRIDPKLMSELMKLEILSRYTVGRVTTRELHNIYFDTEDLELHDAQMALRLRRVGKQWLQTLKGGGDVKAGLHQRNEWEAPVHTDQLDFDALEAMGAFHFSSELRKKLKPMFVTDFSRNTRMFAFEGAQIELSIDRGEIRSGHLSYPISELELELKAGNPLQLFQLALAFLDLIPVEIETISKAEYGYRLSHPIKEKLRKAVAPKLNPRMSVRDAMQQMIWSCVSHLQANLSGAITYQHKEYLHQIRIALRRLRVALNIAKQYCSDKELILLQKMLSDFGIKLGRARDWEVFVAQTLPELQQLIGKTRALKIIAEQSKLMRQAYRLEAQADLQSVEFQRLLLRLGVWMNSEYWQDDKATTDINRFSKKILTENRRKIQRLNNLDKLHKLRVAIKNLRYSLELFSGLYMNKGAQRDLKKLEKLQDLLGHSCDQKNSVKLFKELIPNVKHDNLTKILRGVESRSASFNIAELKKRLKKLAEQPTCW